MSNIQLILDYYCSIFRLVPARNIMFMIQYENNNYWATIDVRFDNSTPVRIERVPGSTAEEAINNLYNKLMKISNKFLENTCKSVLEK